MRHYGQYHHDMSSFILVEKNMSKTNIWFEFLLLKLQNGRNFDENIKKKNSTKSEEITVLIYICYIWKINGR